MVSINLLHKFLDNISLTKKKTKKTIALRLLIEKIILEEEEDADLASGKAEWSSRARHD